MENSGVSFGLFASSANVISLLVLVVVLFVAIKNRTERGLWCITVGGMLNFAERVRYGYVTDYWKVPFLPVYNNVNDWLIFVGAIWFLWKYYMKTR